MANVITRKSYTSLVSGGKAIQKHAEDALECWTDGEREDAAAELEGLIEDCHTLARQAGDLLADLKAKEGAA